MRYPNLDNLLQELTDQGLPCCSLEVAQHGKTLYEGYFGYADTLKTQKLEAKHVFRMASMSKLPLYTMMMMLVDQGKLYLNDPITRYFPEWKDIKRFDHRPDGSIVEVPVNRMITVKDTLTMSSGLPYCVQNMVGSHPTQATMAKCMESLWNRGYYSLREEIRAMSKAVLAFEPGTHWLYGYSSELAAGIIEAVCDKPCNDVYKEMLFDKLGMSSTGPHFFGDIESRMVALYAQQPDGSFVPTSISLDQKHNPGKENETGNPRLFSTGNDYTKLMQMLANGGTYNGTRFMGRKTIDLMRTNALNPVQMKDFADDYNAGYGYGYGVRTIMDKAAGNLNGSIGAFGWTGGFGTWCEADPEDGVSIVFMQNLFPALDNTVHAKIRTAAYGIIE